MLKNVSDIHMFHFKYIFSLGIFGTHPSSPYEKHFKLWMVFNNDILFYLISKISLTFN